MSSLSGFYASTVVGDMRPPALTAHWRVGRNDPSGFRHRESGNFKTGARVQSVGGMSIQNITTNLLDFGSTVASTSGWFYSNTAVLTLNMGEVNTHTDS